MPSLIPDFATLERTLAGLPVVKHRAREVLLTAGSKTGALLFLRSGTVEVVKDGVQIASVNAPGSVFGEQAVLLDQPHVSQRGLGSHSVGRIDERRNTGGCRYQLTKQPQLFRRQLAIEKVDPCQVAARPSEADDKTKI